MRVDFFNHARAILKKEDVGGRVQPMHEGSQRGDSLCCFDADDEVGYVACDGAIRRRFI
ncbi:hypothetical protein GCM10025794_34020 [Massilia kyonggiensis]